jgi:hypothetical protein
VDIVRAAAARVGIEIEFVPVPLEQLRQTLKDGRADASYLGIGWGCSRQLRDIGIRKGGTGAPPMQSQPQPPHVRIQIPALIA